MLTRSREGGRTASSRWTQLRLRTGCPHHRIFGPEIGWARQEFADTGQPISIVKATLGGSSLAVNWNPDEPAGTSWPWLPTWRQPWPRRQEGATRHHREQLPGTREFLRREPFYGSKRANPRNLTAFILALRTDLPDERSDSDRAGERVPGTSLTSMRELNSECSV